MNARQVLPRLALALVLAMAIAWALANRERFDTGTLEQIIRDLGLWAPLAYAGLYIAVTVLLLPGSLIGIIGGVLFGPFWGTIYTLAAATIGATLAFLVARYLVSDWIAAKAGGRLKQLIEGVESEGWRFVAFTRLVPLFPFNLLNYALGLTRIRLVEYVLASFVCMMPGTIAYTWLGYAGREALADRGSLVRTGLIALALLALVGFLPRWVRRWRAAAPATDPVTWIEAPALAARLAREPRPLVIDVRGPEEFAGELGHIAGAINIPIDEFPTRIGVRNLPQAHDIVLVCKTQIRSAKAAGILTQSGFRDVSVLRGGMVGWLRQQ